MSMIKSQLYMDGKKLRKHIEKENKTLFCYICLMGKSTHVVPPSYRTVTPKKRTLKLNQMIYEKVVKHLDPLKSYLVI